MVRQRSRTKKASGEWNISMIFHSPKENFNFMITLLILIPLAVARLVSGLNNAIALFFFVAYIM